MEDSNVYYKKGKKYIPFGLYRSGHDYIPDGIWYVRHYDYSTGITNVDKYIAGLCKVGEVPSRLDLPKLCSIQDYCEYIIDSTKGYIKGNVWVISKRANALKNNATIEELELLVKNLRKRLTE